MTAKTTMHVQHSGRRKVLPHMVSSFGTLDHFLLKREALTIRFVVSREKRGFSALGGSEDVVLPPRVPSFSSSRVKRS